MAGAVWGSAFVGFLHCLHSDPLVVSQPVSGGVSTSVYGEVYTALLLSDGGCFGLLRGIVVCLRTVYTECVVYPLFERCGELFGAESLLLCCIWTKSCVQGKPFAIETESPVQGWNGTRSGMKKEYLFRTGRYFPGHR